MPIFMQQTSLSLLERLRNEPDSESWNRLLEIYSPLLQRWLRAYDVQPCDADDLVQEVLMAIAAELPKFNHNGRAGAFRSWLRITMVHRLKHFWRTRGRRPRAQGGTNLEQRLAELEDPASRLSCIWDREHDRHVIGQLLARSEPYFAPSTWQAFRRVVLEGARADEVGQELGLSLNAVFIAKSRVLNRLRQEAEGMVDSSWDFSRRG